MKRLLASLVVVGLLAACGGSTGSPAASQSVDTASSPSPSPSASPSTAGGSGPLGEPLSTLEAEFTGLGFGFEDLIGAGGDPVGRLGTGADGTSKIRLVGDPLDGLAWSIEPPFMDMGPLHAILGARGRTDVTGWLDQQVMALAASSGAHRADVETGGDPVTFIGDRSPSGDLTIIVVMGDIAAMGEVAPPPSQGQPAPSTTGDADLLNDAMLGYGALATTTNGELIVALAALLDDGATLAQRTAGAERIAAAEAAFASGLETITFPGAASDRAATLGVLAKATVAATGPVIDAADDAELAVALAPLLAALMDEGDGAGEVRTALLSFDNSFGFFSATPPPVNAGALVPAPGALIANGHGLSLENGNGSLDVYLGNPTAAFAIGVSAVAEIYAYEGPLVDTRTLEIPFIAPGTTGIGHHDIVDLRPPGLTPQSVKVTTIAVDEWRAAVGPEILGR